MPTRMGESTPQSVWKKRLVFLAVVLFPLMLAAGLFAPQIVTVTAPEPEPEGVDLDSGTPELDFSRPLPGPPPLLVPRDDGIGFVPELFDLRNLFSHSSRRRDDRISRQFARLASFPRNHGDLIVLDDVDQEIRDIVFRDPLMIGAITEEAGPRFPGGDSPGGPPGDSRPFADPPHFDDPLPEPTAFAPVPEPSSKILLLAGVVYLSFRRR